MLNHARCLWEWYACTFNQNNYANPWNQSRSETMINK